MTYSEQAMAELALTHISSKGQIVIPRELRKGLRKGDCLIVIKAGDRLVLKRATALDRQLAEDLAFARRADAAVRRYERNKGSYRKMSADEFLREMAAW